MTTRATNFIEPEPDTGAVHVPVADVLSTPLVWVITFEHPELTCEFVPAESVPTRRSEKEL
jgi:hypothetical protein